MFDLLDDLGWAALVFAAVLIAIGLVALVLTGIVQWVAHLLGFAVVAGVGLWLLRRRL